jgi:hypothetical protein
MPYCQKVSIRVWDILLMDAINFFLCVVCVPTSRKGTFRMKTEVTVVKCGSTTLEPVRLDQQTGSRCYGTIICILQLELSSLKHVISIEHIPQSNPHLCNISLEEILMWFSRLLMHFRIIFCPDDSPGLHLACASRQRDKQIHVQKRSCVCFTRANRVECT